MIGKYALVACFFLAACGGTEQARKPVPVYDLKLAGRSSGAAFVREGDSVVTLAQRYQLTVEDLINLNLGALRPGQRIALPPPQTYTVRAGDTVVSVAGMHDIATADIIAHNNLMPPYALRVGQVIQLPGKAQPQQMEMASIPVARVEMTPLPGGQMQQVSLTPTLGKFQSPVKGYIISGYGAKAEGLFNDGINIAAAAGASVHAAEAGTVVYAGDGLDGYGNLVLIKHPDNYFTVYSHMAQANVAKGVTVKRGQTIGQVGATGKVTRPQLHFEIRQGTKSLNPADYL